MYWLFSSLGLFTSHLEFAFAKTEIPPTKHRLLAQSVYLLSALQANNRGALSSIGLDDPEYLPVGKSLGWIVPEGLRGACQVLLDRCSRNLVSFS
jgi:hypothetical protein